MTFSVSDKAKLKEAFGMYCEITADKYKFVKDLDIEFSEDFEKKMQNLIKRERKPYYYIINTTAKKVACIIVAIIIFAMGTVLSVDALREGVKNFFVEVYERFSSITFEKTYNAPMIIEKNYKPSFMPSEFEVFHTETTDVSYKLKYRDKEGNEIHYRQSVISDGINVDTEKGVVEEIGDGIYIEQKEYNLKMYFWSNTQYKFSLYAYGNVTKEELLKIADSVTPLKT